MRLNPLRIAMWSGPRNISTAMMRAWENRPDCAVWDEPLYGYYLDATKIPHPGASSHPYRLNPGDGTTVPITSVHLEEEPLILIDAPLNTPC